MSTYKDLQECVPIALIAFKGGGTLFSANFLNTYVRRKIMSFSESSLPKT